MHQARYNALPENALGDLGGQTSVQTLPLWFDAIDDAFVAQFCIVCAICNRSLAVEQSILSQI